MSIEDENDWSSSKSGVAKTKKKDFKKSLMRVDNWDGN